MRYSRPLIEGRLIRRYKRFLADIQLPNGDIVTAHTPNTGSMLGCAEPGSRVWLFDTQNPDRKYPLSWELVETADGVLVGIHTGYANRLVKEAIEDGVISELQGYNKIQTEKKFAAADSRFDLFLGDGPSADCFVEVKNVTAVEGDTAIFPDAVSARGSKHLRGLATAVEHGYRGVLVFCVQREDVSSVAPADAIDKLYGETLRQVVELGVEVLAYQIGFALPELNLLYSLPVRL